MFFVTKRIVLVTGQINVPLLNARKSKNVCGTDTHAVMPRSTLRKENMFLLLKRSVFLKGKMWMWENMNDLVGKKEDR